MLVVTALVVIVAVIRAAGAVVAMAVVEENTDAVCLIKPESRRAV